MVLIVDFFLLGEFNLLVDFFNDIPYLASKVGIGLFVCLLGNLF